MNPTSWRQTLRCLPWYACLAVLAACSSAPPADIGLAQTTQGGALPYSMQTWRDAQDSCAALPADSEDCGAMAVSLARFATQPALNRQIEVRLLDMLAESNLDVRSLKQLRQSFLESASPRDALVLQALPERETSTVLVLALQTYLYQGGANGMAQAEYLNWSIPQQRVLTLDDLLVPGARPQFEAALRRAFDAWLQAKQPDAQAQADYLRLWPYQASANVALAADGLHVQYPLYAIAPRSDGMPVFILPYAELEGVLRPAYLPEARR